MAMKFAEGLRIMVDGTEAEVTGTKGRNVQAVSDEGIEFDVPKKSVTQVIRPLYLIAQEISKLWRPVHPWAAPYHSAMSSLTSVSDSYMFDSGKSIVLYFLSNSQSWKGSDARRIKAELSNLVG